jgi:hypothetical protein
MSDHDGGRLSAAAGPAVTQEAGALKRASAGETGWRRLLRLPFLQRCVVMADVLGPPGGLRGP